MEKSKINPNDTIKRILLISFFLSILLVIAIFMGISIGSTGSGMGEILKTVFSDVDLDPLLNAIIWKLRFPRVLLAALVGGALSLGGLVFQALLRNPLAEPYILGVSGGSAIGAIGGILIGFSQYPGITITAFAGSSLVLAAVLALSSGHAILKQDTLLLAGVMVNSFCSAVIMFLISMTQDSRLHSIMFWLMGDFTMINFTQVSILTAILIPCFILIFLLSDSMNLLLLGKEMAVTMGVNTRVVTLILLITSSFMVSATVSHCGLVGFVGLVIPHLLRLIIGPDHRLLVPACILGGGAYMVFCDLLARALPIQGEMPVGVITAMIGAPLFIILLRHSRV